MIEISIITINYNNANGLKNTLDSVYCQTFTNYEHIIIDGGSTDNSKDIIEFTKSRFSYWVSEKDSGIYNAMNKGIKQAVGKYVLFLNSGDYLNSPNSIELLIKDHKNTDLIYGNLVLQNNTTRFLKIYPAKISFEYFLRDCLPHAATLIKKKLFEQIGFYSEQYKIVSDWEFFMNAICLHNCTYKYVNLCVSVFIQDGVSSNPQNENIINQEKKNILLMTYSAFLPDYERLNQYSAALNNINNSRIHKLVTIVLASSFVRKLKKLSKSYE